MPFQHTPPLSRPLLTPTAPAVIIRSRLRAHTTPQSAPTNTYRPRCRHQKPALAVHHESAAAALGVMPCLPWPHQIRNAVHRQHLHHTLAEVVLRIGVRGLIRHPFQKTKISYRAGVLYYHLFSLLPIFVFIFILLLVLLHIIH